MYTLVDSFSLIYSQKNTNPAPFEPWNNTKSSTAAEVIQVSTLKNDIQVQYLYDSENWSKCGLNKLKATYSLSKLNCFFLKSNQLQHFKQAMITLQGMAEVKQ